MAYGPGDATIAATTADEWIEDNVLDLFSTHNVFLAQLLETSEQPGGDFAFKMGTPAEGGKFKVPVFGKVTYSADGVTRANQVNRITPTVNDDIIAAYFNWAHYQGVATHNYEDKMKNSGKAAMVDLGQAYINQVIAKLKDNVGTDMFDGVIDTADKILAVNFALDNSATVGGIDQTDAANNLWWQAQQDTTTEVFSTYVLDTIFDACTIDTGIPNGVAKQAPDMCLLYNNLFSKLRQELKQSQRIEYGIMLKGGAKYLDYDGMRCFRNTRQTANTVLVLNSSTWAFRYATKAPDPVTEGWVPVDMTPSMWQRGYNWMIGLGARSPKHNGVLKNKSAS